jgi:hypothetical protein
MRLRVRGVVVLIREIGAFFVADALGDLVVRARIVGCNVHRADDDLRAMRLEQADLLLRDLRRRRADELVAAQDTGERQAEPGVAGGRFDHRHAGLQLPGALGRFDHLDADAVLDGGAGVEELELRGEQGSGGVVAP